MFDIWIIDMSQDVKNRLVTRLVKKAKNFAWAGNERLIYAGLEDSFVQKTANIIHIDGDKLEIAFDKAGHKKVVAGFVSKP